VELIVNGERYDSSEPPFRPLALVLREDLGLTGTKIGCAEGRCGACTVLVDGRPVVSCLYPAGLAAGRAITTVEGLGEGDSPLDPLQAALLDAGGVQCGACTPGVLMTLTALLAEDAQPSERAVREALAGNICRCTGYAKIVEAALAVSGSRP
jgi:carbon-monoxide dehydrogenase small subunit